MIKILLYNSWKMSTKRSAGKVIKDIQLRKNANDKIYTPKILAKKMIDMCEIKPEDKVLDPSKGGGIFYDNLPECIKSYCEIEEGIDFFDYEGDVDVIVGNPPYSLWGKWIDKTIALNPKKICYIFGVWNLTPPRLKNLQDKGYNLQKLVFAKVDWWMSPSFMILFEKKESPESFDFIDENIKCENCGKCRCRRIDANVCTVELEQRELNREPCE